jgi:hypothetical protein
MTCLKRSAIVPGSCSNRGFSSMTLEPFVDPLCAQPDGTASADSYMPQRTAFARRVDRVAAQTCVRRGFNDCHPELLSHVFSSGRIIEGFDRVAGYRYGPSRSATPTTVSGFRLGEPSRLVDLWGRQSRHCCFAVAPVSALTSARARKSERSITTLYQSRGARVAVAHRAWPQPPAASPS